VAPLWLVIVISATDHTGAGLLTSETNDTHKPHITTTTHDVRRLGQASRDTRKRRYIPTPSVGLKSFGRYIRRHYNEKETCATRHDANDHATRIPRSCVCLYDLPLKPNHSTTSRRITLPNYYTANTLHLPSIRHSAPDRTPSTRINFFTAFRRP